MRIIHLISSANRGEAKQVKLLRDAAEPSVRHEVWCVSSDAQPADPWQLVDRSIRFRWSVDPVAWARLATGLRKARPDAVHAWGKDAVQLLGRLQALVDCESVVTLNETDGGVGWSRPALRLLKAPRTRVAVTHAELQRSLWDRKVTSTASAVIPFAVGRSEFGADATGGAEGPAIDPQSTPDVRAELGLEPDVPLIGTVTDCTSQERIDELIWACCVLENVQRFGLLVIGDGPHRARLEQCNENTRTTGSVFFLGTRVDRAALLSQCVCYWSAAVGAGVSQGVLEAQAAGIPVIASDTPAHRQLIDDDRTGYLIRADRSADFARRTRRFLADPELGRRLGAAAREAAAQRFSAENARQAYAGLYRDCA